MVLIAAVGIIANYLLLTRSGPFEPLSTWSKYLALDDGPLPPTSPLVASVATVAPTQTPVGSVAAPTTATSVTAGSTPSNPTPTPVDTVYSSINAVDMPGQDIMVDVGGSKATSQGTYGPSGCTAICSSNSGCKASVYSPATKTCWIKSGLTTEAIQSAPDRVLQAPSTATGTDKISYAFDGIDHLQVKLPSATDCKALCGILPYDTCAGSTFDPDTKICSIKNPANNMHAAPAVMSWMRMTQ